MVKMLMLSVLFLLGLAGSCNALGFASPVVNISLDDPAEERWAPLLKVFDINYLKKAAAEVIE